MGKFKKIIVLLIVGICSCETNIRKPNIIGNTFFAYVNTNGCASAYFLFSIDARKEISFLDFCEMIASRNRYLGEKKEWRGNQSLTRITKLVGKDAKYFPWIANIVTYGAKNTYLKEEIRVIEEDDRYKVRVYLITDSISNRKEFDSNTLYRVTVEENREAEKLDKEIYSKFDTMTNSFEDSGTIFFKTIRFTGDAQYLDKQLKEFISKDKSDLIRQSLLLPFDIILKFGKIKTEHKASIYIDDSSLQKYFDTIHLTSIGKCVENIECSLLSYMKDNKIVLLRIAKIKIAEENKILALNRVSTEMFFGRDEVK